MSPVVQEVEEILLRVLYSNKDRAPGFPSARLAKALGFEEGKVVEGLTNLADKELVEQVPEGYRISEKGYAIANQRETSYCPHL